MIACVQAQYNLAVAYEKGDGVEQVSLQPGLPPAPAACDCMGSCSRGHGCFCPCVCASPRALFSSSAAPPSTVRPDSSNRFVLWFLLGLQDLSRALGLYERCAKAAHCDAMFNLAAMLRSGRGTQVSRCPFRIPWSSSSAPARPLSVCAWAWTLLVALMVHLLALQLRLSFAFDRLIALSAQCPELLNF